MACFLLEYLCTGPISWSWIIPKRLEGLASVGKCSKYLWSKSSPTYNIWELFQSLSVGWSNGAWFHASLQVCFGRLLTDCTTKDTKERHERKVTPRVARSAGSGSLPWWRPPSCLAVHSGRSGGCSLTLTPRWCLNWVGARWCFEWAGFVEIMYWMWSWPNSEYLAGSARF